MRIALLTSIQRDTTPRRAPRGERLFRGVADRVVGVDDERGEEVVAAREVAVHGRRDHAHLAGHGPEREGRRPLLGQVAAGDLLDLLGELGAGPVPGGRACSCVVMTGSVAGFREQWNESRAVLLTRPPE